MVNEGWSSIKTNSGGEMLGRSNSKGDIQTNNNSNNNSLSNELELLLLQKEHQQRQRNLNSFCGERDHSLHRSGSAPPTIEGALSILQDPNFALHNDVLTEEEIRSHPAYLAYYYSNDNLNPRLPPPLLSREDWRIAQRVQASGPPIGGFGDSMFLPQLPLQKVEDELVELRKAAVRNLSRKNSTDFLEGCSSGVPKPTMGSRKKSFADIVQGGCSQAAASLGRLSRPSSQDSIGAETSSSELQIRQPCSGSSRSGITMESPPGFPAAVVGKLPLEDKMKFLDAKLHDLSTNDADISRVFASAALSNGHNQNMHQHFAGKSGADSLLHAANYDEFSWGNRIAPQANFHGEVNVPRRSASLANLQSRFNPSEFSMRDQGSHFGSVQNGHTLWRSGSPSCSNLHSLAHPAALPRNQPLVKCYIGSSHPDLRDLEKMYLEALLAQQQQQQLQLPHLYNSGNNINHQCGNPAISQQNISRMPGTLKNQVGGSPRTRSPRGASNMESKLVSSLLEELKNNKGRPPELSDVIDNVVEISMDQYGSRFIQQKLETASTEDKNKIFPQIITHARGLMTDVFGNYVIQKFFEHGTESQTKELGNHLVGHVLPLSLQMYGCRVIQKALEVVDVDQQTQMVSELKGSVMKCVHDQNGNHVIQKCIERVPHEHIQFIVSSFYGQVVTLSTHPYGCRVIQRVLEHSADPKTQKIIMDEIMESVCTLAQDQYGNYVIQHVLQHGKPQDRSEIITKLAGQIVKMSQQKFASNVIEKCLTFGGPEQRQLLINEMLGSTEENEPLQAMMKDPFGNYVVQKVLETCDDKSRELIISRIKVHLYTLKKYTYGKHIVSRVEKLISSGEKHMGVSST